jgi:hypothetical protein
MSDPTGISDAIDRIVSAGPVEVRENGQRLASLADFEYQVTPQSGRALLHLWSEGHSLARRVVRILEQSPERVLLEVERFGQSKPGKLEFALTSVRSAKDLTRDKFREEFAALLREQFPDEEIESLASAADLEHSLSPRYTRGIVAAGSARWAVLAASPAENIASIDSMLTFGLLWLDHCRGRGASRIAGLRLFFPCGSGDLLRHRASALASNVCVELYELQDELRRARRIESGGQGNLVTRLTPRRETESILANAAPDLDPIRALAPDAIAATAVPGTRDVALRFRGAEFARWHEGVVFFGLGDSRARLTQENRGDLKALIRELQIRRSPAANGKSHPMFRMQAERWLETYVVADPSRIDPRIDPRFIYSQVPAFSAGDRGVLDLLGVTRDRRLVIIELKADEDIHLPLQAADYWLRVRWHQRQGDIRSFGYFPGIELSDATPLVYLVAPAIRFHPTTGTLLRYLSDEIEVTRVGLAENWRCGLRVALRQ